MICSVTRSYKKKRARNEAGAFLPKGLRVLVVRTRPGNPAQGFLQAGITAFPCALGRSGITANKHEGDGATPLASMRILSELGIRVMSEKVMDLFAKAGAIVDRDSNTIRIDESIVTEALRNVPSSFTLTSRNPDKQ
ncbi:MAG: hypothetical protein E5V81_10480, partial [Mesorhizobium sp.]